MIYGSMCCSYPCHDNMDLHSRHFPFIYRSTANIWDVRVKYEENIFRTNF